MTYLVQAIVVILLLSPPSDYTTPPYNGVSQKSEEYSAGSLVIYLSCNLSYQENLHT